MTVFRPSLTHEHGGRRRFAHIHFLTSNGLHAGTDEGYDSVVRIFNAILGDIASEDACAHARARPSLKRERERVRVRERERERERERGRGGGGEEKEGAEGEIKEGGREGIARGIDVQSGTDGQKAHRVSSLCGA